MRFGVNYTPTGSWWYVWNDWRPDGVARYLDAIAALGADHVQIMLLWTFFQPNAGWVSLLHLDRLDDRMRLAAARGLDVVVTVFNGHLTGQNFRQGWEHGEDFFISSRLRRAQELFIEVLAARLRPQPNLLGLDLGNELNCCWQGPTDAGDAWMADLLTRCRALLDCDNREKPAAETFRRLATEWRGATQIATTVPLQATTGDAAATWNWLDGWLATTGSTILGGVVLTA